MTHPLGSALEAAGVRLAQRLGLMLAVAFSDSATEYAALRTGCGLIDPSFRGLARLTGEDRTTFLQGMISNDIARCSAGAGVYATMLTVQGRVVSDLRAYVLEGEIWLDVPAQRRATALATLEKYIVADDVEIVDADAVPLILVEGRTAADTFARAFGLEVHGLARCAHRQGEIDGRAVRVAAVTHSGETGYLLLGPAALAVLAWERALAAGAVPVGFDALDVARVEAGIALMDVDMDESVLAPEVGLADALSFRKGCYIGQEVVERVASRGNVQKKLMGLKIAGDEPVAAGTELFADDKQVGSVTSSVRSPAVGCAIALAYVRRVAWEPGSEVELRTATGSIAATVTALPFVAGGAAATV